MDLPRFVTFLFWYNFPTKENERYFFYQTQTSEFIMNLSLPVPHSNDM